MIELGKSKKVTDVLLKLLNFFGAYWRRLELFLDIIFTFLLSLIHRTQD